VTANLQLNIATNSTSVDLKYAHQTLIAPKHSDVPWITCADIVMTSPNNAMLELPQEMVTHAKPTIPVNWMNATMILNAQERTNIATITTNVINKYA